MHRTLFTMQWKLCEIFKRSVLSWPQFNLHWMHAYLCRRTPRIIWLAISMNPSHYWPKSLKQTLIARHKVWVSRVFGDYYYKRMSRATVGVASLRTHTAQWPYVPIIDQNLQHFTGDGNVSKWVKDFWVGQKIPNKQNIQTNWLFLLFWNENAVEICLLSFFTTLIYQHIY